MNFTRTGFLLFVAAGALGIAVLASLEPRRTRDGAVDRHTGERVSTMAWPAIDDAGVVVGS